MCDCPPATRNVICCGVVIGHKMRYEARSEMRLCLVGGVPVHDSECYFGIVSILMRQVCVVHENRRECGSIE